MAPLWGCHCPAGRDWLACIRMREAVKDISQECTSYSLERQFCLCLCLGDRDAMVLHQRPEACLASQR